MKLIKEYLIKSRFFILVLAMIISPLVIPVLAQTIREWDGHMVFKQRSPEIKADGQIKFKTLGTDSVYFVLDTATTGLAAGKSVLCIDPTTRVVSISASTTACSNTP